MPSKQIHHSILKSRHSKDKTPFTHYYQKHQKHIYTTSEKGRGIHIGSLTDFNANTNYNEKKRTERNEIKHQRKGDNHQSQDKAPSHMNEKDPHHLFRCYCKRDDAKHIQQN
jgi:hypothetical protein